MALASYGQNASYALPYSSATDPRAANYQGRLEQKSTPVPKANTGGQQSYAPQPSQQIQAAAPVAPSAPEAPSQPDIDIDAIYNPIIESIGKAEEALRSGAQADTSLIENRTSSEIKKAEDQQSQLLGDTDESQDKFNKTLRSALQEAVRAYNALNQQRIARFGQGSSAGQAVGELAQQEYFRQQGKVGEKQAEGDLQFEKERGRIKQYITSKIDDLNLFKQEAISEIQKNLQSNLASIAAQRGQAESNKARDRLALLQSAREQVFQIEQADKQLRRNLAIDAISRMQEVAGRAFSPQEIMTYIQEFESALPGQLGPIGQQPNEGNPIPQLAAAMTGGGQDEFSATNPVGGQVRQADAIFSPYA